VSAAAPTLQLVCLRNAGSPPSFATTLAIRLVFGVVVTRAPPIVPRLAPCLCFSFLCSQSSGSGVTLLPKSTSFSALCLAFLSGASLTLSFFAFPGGTSLSAARISLLLTTRFGLLLLSTPPLTPGLVLGTARILGGSLGRLFLSATGAAGCTTGFMIRIHHSSITIRIRGCPSSAIPCTIFLDVSVPTPRRRSL
jgi:hypothetical protein